VRSTEPVCACLARVLGCPRSAEQEAPGKARLIYDTWAESRRQLLIVSYGRAAAVPVPA
jgi:hypothetical protein